jgi:hypothetical protein
MWIILLSLLVLVLLLSQTRWEIRHSIEIKAPTEQVWQTVANFAGYAAWNSQLAYLGGEVRLGGELHLKLSAAGAAPYEYRAKLTHLEPNRRLTWLARTGLPGVFDGEHSFELEPTPSGSTRLTNREEYRGVLSWLIKQLPMMKNAPAGFEKMNEELRQWVEAKP